MTTPGGRYRVMDTDPEDGEVQVPTDCLPALSLVDTSGASAPDLAHTLIEVNGERAYENGTFYPPYDGPRSAVTFPYPAMARIRLDYTDPGHFPTLSHVVIHAVSQTLDGLASLNTSYSFTIEDLVGPHLVSVEAVDLRTLRVEFADTSALRMSDPADTRDALCPGNYTVQRQAVPAVEPTAVSVTKLTDYRVEVAFDVQFTPGVAYLLDVKNVEDEWGNVIPGDVLPFTAPSLPWPTTRRWDLWRMLPEKNRREDDDGTGDLRRFIRCLQEVTDLLLYDVDQWTQILDPDFAPEAFLDAMLLDLGNPFAFDLSEIDKRRLLRVLMDIYRRKGTAIGIIEVVRFFLGLDISILCYLDEETWELGVHELGWDTFLGPGDPWGRYAFEIISPVVLTDEQRKRITDLANYMKPAHTHLARIVEPTTPPVYDHLELGISLLDGVEWDLHG